MKQLTTIRLLYIFGISVFIAACNFSNTQFYVENGTDRVIDTFIIKANNAFVVFTDIPAKTTAQQRSYESLAGQDDNLIVAGFGAENRHNFTTPIIYSHIDSVRNGITVIVNKDYTTKLLIK